MPQLKDVLLEESHFPPLDLESPEEALRWIHWAIGSLSFEISLSRIQKIIQDVLSLFKGDFPGYSACDARYHDLEHTLRLLPPFCQLAVSLSRTHPGTILPRDLELGFIAVLLHDAGYIRKKEEDGSGTGAKYTFRHIGRSVDYARFYLPSLGYQEQDLIRVENMIHCTGVKPRLEQINFASEGCRLLGYALGTADLLSQMSDPCYLEKLPLLYLEFQEAYNYEGLEQLGEMEVQPFKSREDLIQNTPFFFKKNVRERLENMGAVYRLLDDPVTGQNHYLEKIKENMEIITP